MYFYTVANMVGIDKINKWATALGLGVKSGIDLPNELQGLVPSTEWKQRVKKEKWYAGETISVGIGQGAVSVTPVSMAVYMATLANGGTRVTPHLLKAVDDGTGWKPVPAPPPQSKVDIDPEKLQAIRDGLWLVVNAAGTGGRARIAGHDVAGKTGSAQVISNAGRLAAAADRTRICGTTAGSCSSRRETIRKSPAWSSSSTVFTARTPRRSRTTFWTRFLRRRTAGRCRPSRRTSRCGSITRTRTLGRATTPAEVRNNPLHATCLNDDCISTSTGRCWRRFSRCAESASR